MQLAQLVEVKGDINLESVQVYSGQGSTGFAPPPPMGGNMGFAPPPPMGGNMGFAPLPPAFGGDFNPGFGFPSAPPMSVAPSFMVRLLI